MNKAILVGFFIILVTLSDVVAPEANPYDFYNINSYNCLHIAEDSQEWHRFNGIKTTIIIGLMNESYGHAWLINTNTREPIVGYSSQFEFIRTWEKHEVTT